MSESEKSVDETATEAPAADDTATEEAVTAEPAAAAEESGRNRRKVREGLVASTGMDKTAVVVVTDRVRHARYSKGVLRSKRLYVHDEENTLNPGDRVRVTETRPLSKSKRWRLLEVVERAR